MSPLSDRSFGVFIANLLPGFISLWSLAPFVPPLANWLDGSMAAEQAPSVGGFLYVTIASFTAGLGLNVVRWVLFDTLNALTGVKRPRWDEGKLQANFDAYLLAVDHHFRYYQFYTCMMLAVGMLYGAHRFVLAEPLDAAVDVAAATFFVLFALAQRDALKRYYTRTTRILDLQRNTMTNGSHPTPSPAATNGSHPPTDKPGTTKPTDQQKTNDQKEKA
ncbi:MAG: hypothetical protein AAGI37_14090 [Planctomycetota bacterium]